MIIASSRLQSQSKEEPVVWVSWVLKRRCGELPQLILETRPGLLELLLERGLGARKQRVVRVHGAVRAEHVRLLRPHVRHGILILAAVAGPRRDPGRVPGAPVHRNRDEMQACPLAPWVKQASSAFANRRRER